MLRPRFRLWQLLLVVAAIAAVLAPITALRRRVAREQAALHEAQVMGGSFSRDDTPSAVRNWLDQVAGGPTRQVRGLSFQNQDDPYDSWGPYGPGGSSLKLHTWTPENIDRLGAALPKLPALVNLSFWRTTLPPGALPKLVPYSSRLRYLGLEETGVGDADVRQVLARVPNLTHLDLSSTDLTDAVLAEVAELKHLQLLRLENTRITDAGLERLRGLRLEELDLGLTLVSEQSAPLLVEMQIAKKLLVPAEWSWEAEAALVKASPARSDVRRTGYRFQDRPDAKATQMRREMQTAKNRNEAERTKQSESW